MVKTLFKLLFRLAAFIFRTVKSLFYQYVPEETRHHFKEEAKDKALTAGKFSFFFALKLIRPAIALILITFVSALYTAIPSVFDLAASSKPLEKRGDGYSEKLYPTKDGFRTSEEIISDQQDIELLQGNWQAQTVNNKGKDVSKESAKLLQFIFTKEKISIKGNSKSDPDRVVEGAYKIDSTTVPKHLDILFSDKTILAIYELNNNELKTCTLDLPKTQSRRPNSCREADNVIIFKKQ